MVVDRTQRIAEDVRAHITELVGEVCAEALQALLGVDLVRAVNRSSILEHTDAQGTRGERPLVHSHIDRCGHGDGETRTTDLRVRIDNLAINSGEVCLNRDDVVAIREVGDRADVVV